MKSISHETISNSEGRNFHNTAISREHQELIAPVSIQHTNSTIARIEMPSPGILLIESKNGDNNTEIISAQLSNIAC